MYSITRPPQLLAGSAILATALFIAAGGPNAIYLFTACMGFMAGTAIAYRYPAAILALTVPLEQIIGLEFQILNDGPIALQIRGLYIYPMDMLLATILSATVVKAIINTSFLSYSIRSNGLAWLFFFYLTVVCIFSVSSAGISAAGEYRTYYSSLILLIYALLFLEDHDQIFLAFRLVTYSFLLLIPAAVVIGLVEFNFSISRSARWLTASGMLGLLHAGIGLLVLKKMAPSKLSGIFVYTAMFAILTLAIITFNRAVWLSAAVAFCLMMMFKTEKNSHLYQIVLASLILCAAFVIFLAIGSLINDFDSAFDKSILLFKSYKDDPTAIWRLMLWNRAIEMIGAAPVFGTGFGRSFAFILGDDLITTSPHNFFLTLGVQSGLLGGILFILFFIRSLTRLYRQFKQNSSPAMSSIGYAAFIITLSTTFYYVAYATDLSTFIYLGLGLAAWQYENGRRIARPA